jgi:phosphotransferase system HPr (HPr) family protein
LGFKRLLQERGKTRSNFFKPGKTVISRTHVIKNKFGLHARPSASFVQTASRYRSEIKVEKDGQVADGKSIMDLMMLAAAQGTSITINAQGEDDLEALEALGTLIEGRFGED